MDELTWSLPSWKLLLAKVLIDDQCYMLWHKPHSLVHQHHSSQTWMQNNLVWQLKNNSSKQVIICIAISPLYYLEKSLRPECTLCINIQSLSFTTTLVQWKLQCKLFTYFTPIKQNGKSQEGVDRQNLTWHVTQRVWHNWVFPERNSPYISVIDPVSIPPVAGMS